MDLVPTKSADQLVRGAVEGRPWMFTPFGVFALSFPGFVLGYFFTVNGTMGSALSVYGTVLVGAVASWLVLVVAFRWVRVSSTHALVMCAGLAAGLYYWWTPMTIADEFGLQAPFLWSARAVSMGIVTVWLLSALTADRRRVTPGRSE